MAKSLFILQGNGSLYNRGCEAILRSTVAILKEEFDDCHFVHCPSGEGYNMRSYDELDPDILHVLYPPKWTLKWFFRQYQKRILRKLPEEFEAFLPDALAVLAVGGDNYTSDYHPRPVARFRYNSIVLEHKRPLILWGASVGPFDKDVEFEKYAAEELKKVTLICARESETISYLERIGVSENVRAVSDPAFVLEPEPVELSGREHILLEEPCLGVNLSPLMERYWQGEQSWQEHATQCVRSLLEEFDFPIILIPHVMIFPGSDDHEFMNGIVESLPEFKERLILLGRNFNCRQLKWIISNLALLVGARTHATIASLSSCVPTVSIGYSLKARGINKDIFGHLDWLVPLKSLQPVVLTGMIGKLIDSRVEVRQYLTEKMPKYKERARLGGKYVREVVSTWRAGL